MSTDPFADPVFERGDVVVCRNKSGYCFTEGGEYTIRKYEPRHHEVEARFTWPAYVEVEDDFGNRVFCHAFRFKKKEET